MVSFLSDHSVHNLSNCFRQRDLSGGRLRSTVQNWRINKSRANFSNANAVMNVFNSDTFQKDIQSCFNSAIYRRSRHASIRRQGRNSNNVSGLAGTIFSRLIKIIILYYKNACYTTYTMSGKQATIVIIAPVRFVSTILSTFSMVKSTALTPL
jgi:hypothetical protein